MFLIVASYYLQQHLSTKILAITTKPYPIANTKDIEIKENCPQE